MMDVGFSKTEVGIIVKALFTASSLAGSVLGGVLMVRLGLLRSMLAFGVLQAVSNLLYCALALAGKSWPIMVAAVTIEHVAAAMGGIVLVALIMALCDVRYSAFQYALLSVLALLPRYSLGYPAGWIADHGGWYTYYVMSFVLALPGLAMVYLTRRQIDALASGCSEARAGARAIVCRARRRSTWIGSYAASPSSSARAHAPSPSGPATGRSEALSYGWGMRCAAT